MTFYPSMIKYREFNKVLKEPFMGVYSKCTIPRGAPIWEEMLLQFLVLSVRPLSKLKPFSGTCTQHSSLPGQFTSHICCRCRKNQLGIIMCLSLWVWLRLCCQDDPFPYCISLVPRAGVWVWKQCLSPIQLLSEESVGLKNTIRIYTIRHKTLHYRWWFLHLF